MQGSGVAPPAPRLPLPQDFALHARLARFQPQLNATRAAMVNQANHEATLAERHDESVPRPSLSHGSSAHDREMM